MPVSKKQSKILFDFESIVDLKLSFIEKAIRENPNCLIDVENYSNHDSKINSILNKYSIYEINSSKFPKLGEDKKYTINEETIHTICKLLEEKRYSDYAIGKMVGVTREYVKDIRHKKRRKRA